MKLKKIRFGICDWFVILYAWYQYADMYIHTSISTLGAYIPMLLICVYGFYQTINYNKLRGFIKMLAFFIVFLSIYGFLYMISGKNYIGTKSTSFLLGNFYSLAPILLFYICTIKGTVDERRMQLYLIVFFIISFLRYNYNFTRKDVSFEDVIFTNNAAYYFVLLLPSVFLFDKKPFFQYLLLIVSLFFVMRGMKRGAIIVTIAFLIIFLVYFRDKNRGLKGSWKKLLSLVFFIIAIYAVFYFVQNVWLSNDYFQRRVDESMEGDSSGRDVLYATLLQHYFNNDNIFNLIFGMGAESTIIVGGTHAHNDWLELLTDCGALGIIFYISYYIKLFKDCSLYRRLKPESFIIISCAIILFLRSLFSMSFMDMHLSLSSVLGYGIAVCQKNNLEVLNNGKKNHYLVHRNN